MIRNLPTLKADPIKPHQFWSGKYCPHKLLDEGWDKFLNQINQYNSATKPIITIEDACNFLNGKAFNDVSGWIIKAKADKDINDIFMAFARGWESMKNTKYFEVILMNVIKNMKG